MSVHKRHNPSEGGRGLLNSWLGSPIRNHTRYNVSLPQPRLAFSIRLLPTGIRTEPARMTFRAHSRYGTIVLNFSTARQADEPERAQAVLERPTKLGAVLRGPL